MSAAESLLAADPVLRFVLLREQRMMAPKMGMFFKRGRLQTYSSELNALRFQLSELKVRWYRARTFAQANELRLLIRETWLSMRGVSEGYFLQVPGGDRAEHVVLFSDGFAGALYPADYRSIRALEIRFSAARAA